MITYVRGAERPTFDVWWRRNDGTLVDFTGATFQLRLIDSDGTVQRTKSSGITAQAGSGTPVSGVPNVVVAWAANDLDVPPGPYKAVLTATVGGFDWRLVEPFFIVSDT